MSCQASFWSLLIVNCRKPSTAGNLHCLAMFGSPGHWGDRARWPHNDVCAPRVQEGQELRSDEIRLGRDIKREESGMFLCSSFAALYSILYKRFCRWNCLLMTSDDNAQAGPLLALVDFRNWQVKVGSVFPTYFKALELMTERWGVYIQVGEIVERVLVSQSTQSWDASNRLSTMPSCWNKGIDFPAQVSLVLCLLKSFHVVSTTNYCYSYRRSFAD